jgi:hypothetical protein
MQAFLGLFNLPVKSGIIASAIVSLMTVGNVFVGVMAGGIAFVLMLLFQSYFKAPAAKEAVAEVEAEQPVAPPIQIFNKAQVIDLDALDELSSVFLVDEPSQVNYGVQFANGANVGQVLDAVQTVSGVRTRYAAAKVLIDAVSALDESGAISNEEYVPGAPTRTVLETALRIVQTPQEALGGNRVSNPDAVNELRQTIFLSDGPWSERTFANGKNLDQVVDAVIPVLMLKLNLRLESLNLMKTLNHQRAAGVLQQALAEVDTAGQIHNPVLFSGEDTQKVLEAALGVVLAPATGASVPSHEGIPTVPT